jgi:hypothetical protein
VKSDHVPVRESTESSLSTAFIGVKRTYTEFLESRVGECAEKLGRVDNQGRGMKTEDDDRPHSTHGQGHEKGHGRGYNHDRELSPALQTHDGAMTAARVRDSRTQSKSQERQICRYWATPGMRCRYAYEECLNLHTFSDTPSSKPSSNSLTCWYWATPVQNCIHTAKDCKYLHGNTGTIAKPPPSARKWDGFCSSWAD